MNEHEYIVVSGLTRLRAISSLLGSISPVKGVHDARDGRGLGAARVTVHRMIGKLEGEVGRLMEGQEDGNE